MSKQKSGRLKLFGEPQPRRAAADNPLANHALVEAFAAATGWRIAPSALHANTKATLTSSAPAYPGVGASPGHSRIVLQQAVSDGDRIPRPAAEALAEHFVALVAQLEATRDALRLREADLASHVPVTARRDEQPLAVRLEQLLHTAATAVDCQSAALYLLDDATTELKLRCAWNLPVDRFLAPARSLRGATADLEALLGHAVVLTEPELFRVWNAPEQFPAAACVPVSNASTQLGTLWVFASRNRDFSDTQTNILEIAAGRIAADLEREVLLAELLEVRNATANTPAPTTPLDACPAVGPIIEGWDLAVRSSMTGPHTATLLDWFETANQCLTLVLGQAHNDGTEGAIAAATLRGAARAHAGSAISPDTLLGRMNTVLWTGGAGSLADILSVQLTPHAGTVQISSAGVIEAAVLRGGTFGNVELVTAPLGGDEEPSLCIRSLTLAPGEILVAVAHRNSTRSERGQSNGRQVSTRSLNSFELPPSFHSRNMSDVPAARVAETLLQSLPGDAASRRGDPTAVLVIKRTS